MDVKSYRCSHCKEVKGSSGFVRNIGTISGLDTSRCKSCKREHRKEVPFKLKCAACGEVKWNYTFSKSTGCVSGYSTSQCKACKRSARDWSKVPLNKRIFNGAKGRATKKGLEFNIELSDIVIPEECPVFHVPFVYGDTDLTYSIDRVDSSLGYVKGNISIISNKANRIKNNATVDDLKAVINYMESHNV